MPITENNRIIIDLDICTQTEECADICPDKAIVLESGYPILIKDCMDPCTECIRICPASAITKK